MTTWASGWSTFPITFTSDTILYRFTYITDTNSTAYAGWIIDDMYFEDWAESIPEHSASNEVFTYPNPATSLLRIQYPKLKVPAAIQVFSSDRRLLLEDLQFETDVLSIDSFTDGIYFQKYANDEVVVVKKFIVKH